jgi:hypothetical protein
MTCPAVYCVLILHNLRTFDDASTVCYSVRAVSTIAGVGGGSFSQESGQSAYFNQPHDVKVDPVNKRMFIADLHNYRIRMLDMETNLVRMRSGEKWHILTL